MYALNKNAETLKQNAANSYAKSSGGGRIEDTGAYNAMIDCAAWEDYNGWKKLVIYLVDENEKRGILEFPYENPQGERMFGADSLDALMITGGIRSNLTEAKDNVMRWSFALNSMNEDEVNSCPELKNKWFKFLIRKTMDAYEVKVEQVKTGEIKEFSTLSCAGIFQHQTDLSAVEIMEKITQPVEYFDAVTALDGYPLGRTKRHKQLVTGATTTVTDNKKTNENNDLDDDLPF